MSEIQISNPMFNEFMFKVIIVGNTNVGKTNILTQYTDHIFNEDQRNTIGIDFKMFDVNYKEKNLSIQFWDTAGQEKFRAMSTSIYKNANGAIIVYDITDMKSFDSLTNWIVHVREACQKNTQIIILGNKKDLTTERRVTEEQGKYFAQEHGVFFMEVSAKDNSSKAIEKAMEQLYGLLVQFQDEESMFDQREKLKMKRQAYALRGIDQEKEPGCSC